MCAFISGNEDHTHRIGFAAPGQIIHSRLHDTSDILVATARSELEKRFANSIKIAGKRQVYSNEARLGSIFRIAVAQYCQAKFRLRLCSAQFIYDVPESLFG